PSSSRVRPKRRQRCSPCPRSTSPAWRPSSPRPTSAAGWCPWPASTPTTGCAWPTRSRSPTPSSCPPCWPASSPPSRPIRRGDQVGGGYVGVESQVDAEGWLHTGDQGSLDADGYLFVLGRADDVIIRGGENISPSEIEDALLRHPAVVGAAVVGLPDEEWGE